MKCLFLDDLLQGPTVACKYQEFEKGRQMFRIRHEKEGYDEDEWQYYMFMDIATSTLSWLVQYYNLACVSMTVALYIPRYNPKRGEQLFGKGYLDVPVKNPACHFKERFHVISLDLQFRDVSVHAIKDYQQEDQEKLGAGTAFIKYLRGEGHSNLILIDNKSKTAQLIEPHGYETPWTPDIVLSAVKRLVSWLPEYKDYRVVEVAESCPATGPQSVSEDERCRNWTFLTVFLRLLCPVNSLQKVADHLAKLGRTQLIRLQSNWACFLWKFADEHQIIESYQQFASKKLALYDPNIWTLIEEQFTFANFSNLARLLALKARHDALTKEANIIERNRLSDAYKQLVPVILKDPRKISQDEAQQIEAFMAATPLPFPTKQDKKKQRRKQDRQHRDPCKHYCLRKCDKKCLI